MVINLLVKGFKNWINSNFREKVIPIAGSVIYTDLYVVVEHSGISEDGESIIDVKVDDIWRGRASVRRENYREFCSKSFPKNKIYVSSNEGGAVGSDAVSDYAISQVKKNWHYNLLSNNCHIFSLQCLKYSPHTYEKLCGDFDETCSLDYTIKTMKETASFKIGANKWLFWDLSRMRKKQREEDFSSMMNSMSNQEMNSDNINQLLRNIENSVLEANPTDLEEKIKKLLNGREFNGESRKKLEKILSQYLEGLYQNESAEEQVEKPNFNKLYEKLKDEELNDEKLEELNESIEELKNYLVELKGEGVPTEATREIENGVTLLGKIRDTYMEKRGVSKKMGINYSYRGLEEIDIHEMNELFKIMELNSNIKRIVERMGRDYITEEQKKQPYIYERNTNEIFGTRKSDDIFRMLPSELINLEDEDLEYLFYAKLLEKNLQTYEIVDKTLSEERERLENIRVHKKGPIIACLDTSGSMNGSRITLAKSLLLSISNRLIEEDRKLYVILFGSTGQTSEMKIESSSETPKLLKFLKSGFGGGTDFETPLSRGVEILQSEKESYKKADILMITDGQCGISSQFKERLEGEKRKLNFRVYTVICEGAKGGEGDFSDEIINI